MNLNFILLFVAVFGCVALITVMRRHQRSHCAHIHGLSLAVLAIAEVFEKTLPGELPADLQEFVRWFKDDENDDTFLDEDKLTADAA